MSSTSGMIVYLVFIIAIFYFMAIRPQSKEKKKQAEKEEELLFDENIKVVITPNTTKVKPMDQIRFTENVEGTSNKEVRWSVTEPGAGTIDGNGLYTAPSKEGVYEIKAQSVKFEDKSDSAYVVVSAEE